MEKTEMKRTFLKVLPFAVAVLFATSCSKDDSNSVDEIVNGGDQIENVTKTFKTLTVKGKVNKSISKVTTNDAGTALAFDGNEVFTFGNEGDDVYGTIDFKGTDGSYTATIYYTDESKLTTTDFTATLGENPALISDAYDNLAIAVQHACYTTDFNIVQGDEGYKLQSENSADIIVNLQSAFIKALSDESNTLGGEGITVKEGKYYVVPVGKAMGSSGQNTIAGKIYNLGFIYVDLGVKVDGKSVYWAQTNLYDEKKWSELTTDEKNNMPKQADFEALWNNCYWQWGNDGTNDGYYVFKPYAADDKQETNASEHIYSTTSDSYIFLPAVFNDGSRGIYWSGESSDNYRAFCLGFNKNSVNVDPWNLNFVNYGVYSVRLVRRSN